VHSAEVEDIIGIFDLVDARGLLKSVTFAAADLMRIPPYSPEQTNMCTVTERQSHLEATVEQLAATVSAAVSSPRPHMQLADDEVLQKVMEEVDCKVDKSLAVLQNKLDNMSSLVADSLSSVTSTHSSAVNTSSARSCERNVVLFGLPENRDRSVWNRQVSDVLHFVAGRDVEVSDAFRLGKYKSNSERARPILISLKSVWDKRLVLANCRRLSECDDYMKKVYIVADEPVETRRKKTLQHTKDRYSHNNHVVELSSDGSILFVDGKMVFSVKDGKVSSTSNNNDG